MLLEAIPRTTNLKIANLQYNVGKIYNVNPFHESILNLTKVQMYWIVEMENAKHRQQENQGGSYSDPDFDAEYERLRNGG